MYGITIGSDLCPLFYEDKGERTTTFNFEQLKSIVALLLDRKARNNGVGKYLTNTTKHTGSFRYDFPGQDKNGMLCLRTKGGRYAIKLYGDYPHELLKRLNRAGSQALAIAATRLIRAERRRLRALGLYQDPPKATLPRALAGANGGLKRHFRNTELTCADAIVAISRASEFKRSWVQKRLLRSLDERGVATVRLKGGFVFRVDIRARSFRLLHVQAPVELRTTNDNQHPAYRRLRKALRAYRRRPVVARFLQYAA